MRRFSKLFDTSLQAHSVRLVSNIVHDVGHCGKGESSCGRWSRSELLELHFSWEALAQFLEFQAWLTHWVQVARCLRLIVRIVQVGLVCFSIIRSAVSSTVLSDFVIAANVGSGIASKPAGFPNADDESDPCIGKETERYLSEEYPTIFHRDPTRGTNAARYRRPRQGMFFYVRSFVGRLVGGMLHVPSVMAFGHIGCLFL